jgi:hypothetical protein
MADLTWYQKILSHPRLQRVVANRYGRAGIALGISCLAHVPCVLMLTGTLALSGASGALLMHPLAIMASSFALLVGGHLASKALCNRYCAWASCLLADTRPTLAPVQSFAQGIADAGLMQQRNYRKNTGLTMAAFGIAGAQGFFIAPMLHRHPANTDLRAGQNNQPDYRFLLQSRADDQHCMVIAIRDGGEVTVYAGDDVNIRRDIGCGAMIWDGLYHPLPPNAPPKPAATAQALIRAWGGVEFVTAQVTASKFLPPAIQNAYRQKLTFLAMGSDTPVFIELPSVARRAEHHKGGR